MRRAAERPYVTGLTQLGIRNVSSTAREGYADARRMGSDILSVRQIRKLGTEAVLDRIPAGARYYVTIDIDGFDPSIAAGTGTPVTFGATSPTYSTLAVDPSGSGTVIVWVSRLAATAAPASAAEPRPARTRPYVLRIGHPPKVDLRSVILFGESERQISRP